MALIYYFINKSIIFVTSKIKIMKKVLYILLVLALPMVSLAQSVEIIDPILLVEGSLSNTDDNEMDVHWDVVNTSSNVVNISCRREVLTEVDGSRNKFCWGPLCYGWSTDQSPEGMDVLMVPGATNSTFHGYYQAQGNAGCTQVKYCFFNINDENDQACVTTVFSVDADCSTVGVEELTQENMLNNVAPNPVVGLSTFTYSFNGNANNSQIIIYNMVGSVVKEIPLNSNKGAVIIDGRDFETGIYLYALVVDGNKVSTKRMIVAK